MPKYAAEINENNIVLRVIVVDDLDFCNQLGGTWVETFIDNPIKNYAGPNYTYHPDKDNFSSPKPFDNWVLNDDCDWEPPIPKPEGDYWWNQETNEWLEIPEQYINIEDILNQ